MALFWQFELGGNNRKITKKKQLLIVLIDATAFRCYGTMQTKKKKWIFLFRTVRFRWNNAAAENCEFKIMKKQRILL